MDRLFWRASLASRGLQYGVEAHMRRAMDYGATKEELFEAIKAAAVPGGGVAYSVGVRALQASPGAGRRLPGAQPATPSAQSAEESHPTVQHPLTRNEPAGHDRKAVRGRHAHDGSQMPGARRSGTRLCASIAFSPGLRSTRGVG
jgi:hypothetical protein